MSLTHYPFVFIPGAASAIAEESHISFRKYQLLEQEDTFTRRCKNRDRVNGGMPREKVKHLWLDKGIPF